MVMGNGLFNTLYHFHECAMTHAVYTHCVCVGSTIMRQYRPKGIVN